MKKEVKSIKTMNAFAADFLSGLAPTTQATIVGLSGDLGSGKTTFVQSIARALGITDQITSPTFVIIKSYALKAKSYNLLIHIDAYRLESATELEALRFSELVSDPTNIIFIEWPEQVKDNLPRTMRTINFTFVDETTREMEVK